MFSLDILFFSKQEENSVTGVRLFNLFPVQINLCKRFTCIKCRPHETTEKMFLCCFKMFTLTESCNKRTHTGSNSSRLTPLTEVLFWFEMNTLLRLSVTLNKVWLWSFFTVCWSEWIKRCWSGYVNHKTTESLALAPFVKQKAGPCQGTCMKSWMSWPGKSQMGIGV